MKREEPNPWRKRENKTKNKDFWSANKFPRKTKNLFMLGGRHSNMQERFRVPETSIVCRWEEKLNEIPRLEILCFTRRFKIFTKLPSVGNSNAYLVRMKIIPAKRIWTRNSVSTSEQISFETEDERERLVFFCDLYIHISMERSTWVSGLSIENCRSDLVVQNDAVILDVKLWRTPHHAEKLSGLSINVCSCSGMLEERKIGKGKYILEQQPVAWRLDHLWLLSLQSQHPCHDPAVLPSLFVQLKIHKHSR
jgi:hypothetical protein